jgi:hypothetical protein
VYGVLDDVVLDDVVQSFLDLLEKSSRPGSKRLIFDCVGSRMIYILYIIQGCHTGIWDAEHKGPAKMHVSCSSSRTLAGP